MISSSTCAREAPWPIRSSMRSCESTNTARLALVERQAPTGRRSSGSLLEEGEGSCVEAVIALVLDPVEPGLARADPLAGGAHSSVRLELARGPDRILVALPGAGPHLSRRQQSVNCAVVYVALGARRR